jgi:hypothetical protein
MKGIYIPFNEDYGIVGFHFKCPKCNHTNEFSTNEGCDKCDFKQEYKDADDWYEQEMNKPKTQRAWNVSNQKKSYKAYTIWLNDKVRSDEELDDLISDYLRSI